MSMDGNLDKWPPGQPNVTNTNLKAFADKYRLVDIWRKKYPNRSYTWSNKTGSSQSRIDLWLVSENFNKDLIDVEIWPTPP